MRIQPGWMVVPVLLICFVGHAVGAARGETMSAADSLVACDVLYEKCDLAGAAEMARAILAHDPDSYEATWKLSRALIGVANLEKDEKKSRQGWLEARKFAHRAVGLNATGAQGYTCLAICEGSLSGFAGGREKIELAAQARDAALRALDLDERNDLACLVLGVWNREIATVGGLTRLAAKVFYGGIPAGASLDNSETLLRRAVALAPDHLNHHRELAITLMTMGRLQEAVAELETTVGLGWKRPGDPVYAESALELLVEIREEMEDSRDGNW